MYLRIQLSSGTCTSELAVVTRSLDSRTSAMRIYQGKNKAQSPERKEYKQA